MNPYLVLVGVAAVSIFGGLSYYKGYEGGQEAVQQAWDKEKAETAAAAAFAARPVSGRRGVLPPLGECCC